MISKSNFLRIPLHYDEQARGKGLISSAETASWRSFSGAKEREKNNSIDWIIGWKYTRLDDNYPKWRSDWIKKEP
jgi:hypothetical protein